MSTRPHILLTRFSMQPPATICQSMMLAAAHPSGKTQGRGMPASGGPISPSPKSFCAWNQAAPFSFPFSNSRRAVLRMSQFELLTAPMLAGTQGNWLLLGMLSLQVYKFHVCFPKEHRWIKALVYTLYTLEIVQTAVTSHFVYSLLVVGWGDPAVFSKLPWSSLAVPLFTGITSASVQTFFAWRIWTLKGEFLWARAVAVFIVMLALMQSLAALISDARFAVTTQVSELQRLMLGVKVWLIGSAVCDVVITFTMLFILTQYRMKTPWKRTDSLITKLIYNTIETGAITSVVAIVDVTLFILYTQTNLHQTPAFMLGKLYTSVLLATLNSRAEMRAEQSGVGGHNYSADPPGTEVRWRRQTTRENTTARSGATELGTRKMHITTMINSASDTDPIKGKNVYEDSPV
ncbi:hypothetical protein GGX14DRAFT_695740 [Mycena pura]|uniref:DUF6534 domain-containing protein n=1 Tax=Mycena pura TaxID=153505 RepID=A0AAD6VP17_9AGAR|nr:hypothetical protein GGX14DRAFT_695740 [Mycena pura]